MPATPAPSPNSPADSSRPANCDQDPRRSRGSEILLATVIGANLCFLPWAFGGIDVWSQAVSAALAAAALLLSLRTGRGTGQDAIPKAPDTPPADAPGSQPHSESAREPGPSRRLRHFPVFWAGPALFVYVAMQAFNPAYDYHATASDWWLTPVAHVSGLPAGMSVPFRDAGPWRALLPWFSAWAVMCAAWLGLRRRAVVIGLLSVIAGNGFALAAYGMVQRTLGSNRLYGLRRVENGEFFAPFIYKNHAAAYLLLLALLAGALAVHAFRHNQRRHGPGGPDILYFLFAVTLSLGVILTASLSGVLLLAIALLGLLPLTAVRLRRFYPGLFRPGPGLAVVILLLGLLGLFGTVAGYTQFRSRLEDKLSGGAYESGRTRWLASSRGAVMWSDRWVYGWGAGCFRYGFTKYQRAEPALSGTTAHPLFWEHVHNDWLELLIELGVVGSLPVFFITGYWFRLAVRQRICVHASLVWIVSGIGTVAVFAWIDFPSQCPAILVTVAALIPLIFHWHEVPAKVPVNGRPG